ncbi:unnamed protein product [Brassica rapa subsp. trilocularis]
MATITFVLFMALVSVPFTSLKLITLSSKQAFRGCGTHVLLLPMFDILDSSKESLTTLCLSSVMDLTLFIPLLRAYYNALSPI